MAKIMKVAMIGVAALVFLFCAFFALMQTQWAQTTMRLWVTETLQKNGINLSAKTLKGSPPFSWTLKEVQLSLNETDSITIDRLRLRIAILPLLRKQLSISYLSIHEAVYRFAEKPHKENELGVPPFVVPLNFSIKTLKVDNFCAENVTRGAKQCYTIRAQGKIKGNDEEFFAIVHLSSLSLPSFHADLFMEGEHKKDRIIASLKMKTPSAEIFSPFIALPVDGSGSIDLQMGGPWDTWKTLLEGKEISSAPLKGTLKGQIETLRAPSRKLPDHPWGIDASFLLYSDRSLNLSRLKIDSALFQVDGSGEIDKEKHLTSAQISFSFPDLGLWNKNILQGSLQGAFSLSKTTAQLHFSSNDFILRGQPYEHLLAEMKAEREGKRWTGSFSFNGIDSEIPLSSSIDFHLERELLTLTKLQLMAADSVVNGYLTLEPSSKLLEGTLFVQSPYLSRFEKFIPDSFLAGRLGGSAHFSKEGEIQTVEVLLGAQNVHFFNTVLSDLLATIHFTDLYQEVKGSVSLEAKHLYLPEIYFSDIALNTAWKEEKWNFTGSCKGMWKDPLEVALSGFFVEGKEFSLEKLEGNLLQKALLLPKPCSLVWEGDHRRVTPCEVQFGEGILTFSADLSPQKTYATAKGSHIPLDLFSFFSPHFTLHGSVSLDAVFEEAAGHSQGRFSLTLEEADVLQSGKKEMLRGKGTLQANLNQDTLQLHTYFKATGEQFFECSATLPTHIHLYPFSFHFDKKRPLSSTITMEGNLEEIFDFINIGSHRTTGLISMHLFLSKTLSSPSLQGVLELQKGSYENYVTGTLFKEIQARAEAEHQKIKLFNLTAKDKEKGQLTAQGEILLHPDEHYPYTFACELSQLEVVDFDSLTVSLTGPLTISGTTKSSIAKGDLTVSRAEFRIPDQLPVELPTLPITYINQPPHLKKRVAPPAAFPFQYDLNLSASGNIKVEGRGLNSEWEGNLHLVGTNMNIASDGKLNLLKGEFLFSGKMFSLIQGEIAMTSKPTQGAYLTLSGTLTLPELSVTALLRGPISSPVLTFQSMPPLPTSSVLSLILFNKDISEIDPFQAIQLAQTIVTLSGGAGPGVLEKIRKSIGVDRLNIVSSTSGTEDISVQIGKYLTRGVMVTLSQSATSSNVIVEVDLTKGFIFQAETQEEQEGKFSLKWHRNY